jgi:DNA-binding PadR family transcriptional regulator
MDAKTLCLGALCLRDASGYEIKKLFEDGDFSHFCEPSFGSIYPALNRLVEDGLASFTAMPQDKRPDKKVYSITAKGRDAFCEALKAPPAPDKYRSDFCFMMVFGHLLPRDRLAQLMDIQNAYYKGMIARMESCEDLGEAPPPARFVHELGLAVFRAAADYIDQNKDSLLDETTAAAADTTRAAE